MENYITLYMYIYAINAKVSRKYLDLLGILINLHVLMELVIVKT